MSDGDADADGDGPGTDTDPGDGDGNGDRDGEAVLITGGTGFVGSRLAAALVGDGHDVVVLDRDADAGRLDRLGVADAVEVVAGDVTDGDRLAELLESAGATRVVHLAALLTDDTAAGPRAATRVNVGGAAELLDAARRVGGVDRVVLASSETVYAAGSAYGDGPVAEDALLCPDSPYSAAKRYAECLAARYREAYDLPAVALRPTGVFGPFRRSFTAYDDLFARPAVGESARVEGGGTTVSWLSVVDAADAFRRAALADAGDLSRGVYNVRGEVATVREAAAAVRAVTGGAVEVVDDADRDWAAQRLSLSAARTDLGYEVRHDLATLARTYADAVRRERGLDPL